MQNQVNINVHAHRNSHVHRSTHTQRNAQETRSYREVHNSHENKKIGGADDLRLVSSLPVDVIQGNLICLVSYLKTQRAHDEQYYMEMLERLGAHEMPQADTIIGRHGIMRSGCLLSLQKVMMNVLNILNKCENLSSR